MFTLLLPWLLACYSERPGLVAQVEVVLSTEAATTEPPSAWRLAQLDLALRGGELVGCDGELLSPPWLEDTGVAWTSWILPTAHAHALRTADSRVLLDGTMLDEPVWVADLPAIPGRVCGVTVRFDQLPMSTEGPASWRLLAVAGSGDALQVEGLEPGAFTVPLDPPLHLDEEHRVARILLTVDVVGWIEALESSGASPHHALVERIREGVSASWTLALPRVGPGLAAQELSP